MATGEISPPPGFTLDEEAPPPGFTLDESPPPGFTLDKAEMPVVSEPPAFGSQAVHGQDMRPIPEGEAGVLETIGKSITQVPPLFQAVAGGQVQALGEAVEEGDIDLENLRTISLEEDEFAIPEHLQGQEFDAGQALAETGRATALAGFEEAQRRAPDVPEGSGRALIRDVTVALGMMGPTLVTGAVTRNPTAALSVMFPQVYGLSYADAREKGLTPSQSRLDSTIRSVAEIATEKIPLGIILKRGGSAITRMFKSSGAEGIQEAVMSGIDQLLDTGVLTGETTFTEALEIFADPETWKQVGWDAAVGALVAPIMAGAVSLTDIGKKAPTEEVGPPPPEGFTVDEPVDVSPEEAAPIAPEAAEVPFEEAETVVEPTSKVPWEMSRKEFEIEEIKGMGVTWFNAVKDDAGEIHISSRAEHGDMVNELRDEGFIGDKEKPQYRGWVWKGIGKEKSFIDVSDLQKSNGDFYQAYINKGTVVTEDRRAAPHEETVERRADEPERVRVEHMTETQLREALLTSDKTPLLNERAYNETEREANQAFMDIDDFKDVNAELTYEGADQVLNEVGKVMQEEAEAAGIKAFHLHGDEFISESSDKAALEAYSDRVQKRLAESEFDIELSDGRTFTTKGTGVSYGIGDTKQTAEESLKTSKAERLAAGVRTGSRAARGREPVSVSEPTTEGREDRQRESTAEILVEKSPKKKKTTEALQERSDAAHQQSEEVTELDKKPVKGPKGTTLYSNPLNAIYENWQKLGARSLKWAEDAFGWRFTALGKLPAQKIYLQTRYKLLGKIANVDQVARKIYDTFADASTEDKNHIYEYLTQRDADSSIIKAPDIRRRAVSTKRLIDRVGRALVERGLLSQKAYEAHKGSYLPRLYLKHLLDEGIWKSLGTGKKVSDLGYLKKRKDIPDEVRKVILGEITDPGYLASKGTGQSLRDMAILDFLSEIAGNENWIYEDSVVKWNGRTVSAAWLSEEAKRLESQAAYYNEATRKKALKIVEQMRAVADPAIESTGKIPDDFRQIPNTARYGRLRGMFVRKEIYNDLIGTGNAVDAEASPAEWLLGYGGFGTKVTQLWKMSKVALNPPTQVRNFVSNGIMLHWSGVPFHRVPQRVIQALSEMAHNGKHWRIAKKWGVTGSTFSANELFRIEREITDLESRTDQAGGKKFTMARLKNIGAIIGNTAGDVYQLSEGVFKTAKIIDAMEREGKSEADAMIEAQKWLYDYSLIPASVRYLRNAPIGVPFLTFYYKTAPRFAEVVMKNPERLIPYFAIPAALAAYIADDYDVDMDDLKTLKKALPLWLQERGNAHFLPYKDKFGRWQALDIGYFLPWGMFVEAGKEAAKGNIGGVLGTTGMLGGPIPGLIAAMKTGIDPFTGRPIFNELDPASKQISDIMMYLWRLSAPTFTTDIGFAGHMKRAIFEEVDRHGDPKSTHVQAALRLVGVNVYPIEPTKTRRANLSRMTWEMKEMQRRMKTRMRDRNLKPEDRREIRKDYKKLIDEQRKRIKEYREESKIHPHLR